MKIGIIGTRGIPNFYGGFEQFAEYFSVYLQEKGHEVYVYNSSLHPFEDSQYKGVHIIRCYDPEDNVGTFGQMIYDLNCIIDARKRNFDIILQLGYTSSGIWNFLLPTSSKIITNIDGMEWKRSKYNVLTKQFLKLSEKWAIHRTDEVVCDSIGIKEYVEKAYGIKGHYIAYGADIPTEFNSQTLQQYHLQAQQYSLLIARMEPENNIEMILEAYSKSSLQNPLVVIGNVENNAFGKKMKEAYGKVPTIRFLGGIYSMNILNDLRYFSQYYFHGHSVGGTNPSLIEAMACNCKIIAHDNRFNQTVLENNALYFRSVEELMEMINTHDFPKVENLAEIVKSRYSFEKIHTHYLSLFEKCLEN